jgi:RNA polymerase sigma-70 factor (ECF subfamily)
MVGLTEGACLDEIEAVYRRRLPELRRVATAITGSRESALDAVQEAFALAVHHRRQFRGEGSLDAWLWRIVVRRARDARADGGRARAVSLDRAAEPEQRGEDALDGREGELHALVAELPERQRFALFLRYYADLDYATIAQTLEISGGTVGATLNQARDSLRRAMTEVRS